MRRHVRSIVNQIDSSRFKRQQQVDGIDVSEDGGSVATAVSSDKVRIWNAHTGKEIGQGFGTENDFLYDVTFSPDGRLLYAMGYGPDKVWDLTTQKEVATLEAGNIGVFSPDGKYLAVTPMDLRQTEVWELR